MSALKPIYFDQQEDLSVNYTENNQTWKISMISPETFVKIKVGLETQQITPNKLMLHAIVNGSNLDCLRLIGLSLQYGASPDVYVTVDNKRVHILVYIYTMLLKHTVSLIADIGNLIVLAGANSDLIADKMGTEMTIREYLDGRNILLTRNEIGQNLVSTQLKFYALLLDDPSLFSSSRSPNLPKIKECIIYHANRCLYHLLVNGYNNKIISSQYLNFSLDYFNISAFIHLLSVPIDLPYYGINHLLIKIANKRDDIIYPKLKQLLYQLIDYGITFDQEQWEIIRRLKCGLENDLMDYYYLKFKKIKEINMRNLAVNLRMNISQIYSDLPLYPFTPKLISASLSLPLARLHLDDLNRIMSVGSYIDLAIHKSKGILWIYPSYEFDHLLTEKKNIYTEEEFKENFLEILRGQRSINKRLTYLKRAEQRSDELINSRESDRIVGIIVNLGKLYGVNEQIMRNLTTTQYQKILKNLIPTKSLITNFDLETLNPNHRFITFCHLIYDILVGNSEKIKEVMEYFKQLYT